MESRAVSRKYLFAAAVLALAAFVLPARTAQDSADWRSRALALNDVTGDLPMAGEAETLLKHPAAAKKLLATALGMARAKDQPFNYNAASILAQVAEGLKDVEAGQTFYRICIDKAEKVKSAHRMALSYWGLLDLLYDNKRYDETLRVCRDVVEMKEDPQVLGRREGYLLIRSLKVKARDRMIQALGKQGKTEEALKLVHNQIKARPDDWKALLLKATVLHDAGRSAQEAKTYEQILDLVGKDKSLDREKKSTLQAECRDRMIQALSKQGKTEEALKLVDNQIKARPDDWQALLLRASVLHDAGRTAQEAQSYEQILDLVGKDKSLDREKKSGFQADCRYILSGLYAEMGQVDKAAEQLLTLLEEKPNNPTYNNDLGYIWADHNMHLDKAEKMIRLAIDEERKQRKKDPALKPDEDKDNAAFLDSLGWVLFKQKKYPEARKYLEEAVKDKKDGQHTEIYDHLGDVYMALGEKDQAVAAWKKAVKLAQDSKRDQERKLKIEKKIKGAKGGSRASR